MHVGFSAGACRAGASAGCRIKEQTQKRKALFKRVAKFWKYVEISGNILEIT